MIAFFCAHHIFPWQPKGEGGGVKPPKPPRSAPATSYAFFFFLILIYWSGYIICWSLRITRFQRIQTFTTKNFSMFQSLRDCRSPAPADIGRQRAHRYYQRSIATVPTVAPRASVVCIGNTCKDGRESAI